MFQFLPFYKFGFNFAGEAIDSGDSGKGGSTPGDSGAESGEKISKAEYDKLVEEQGKLKQELEDTRMEIMTPEYLEWLNNRDGSRKPEPEHKSEDVDYSKMTPAQIAKKVAEETEARIRKEMDNLRNEVTSSSKAQTQKEVAAFSRTHSDFESFRPVMYGLSLDPKNKDLTLPELYEEAKKHVARIHTPATPEEKKRQVKLSTDKPGHTSESFVPNGKKLTSSQAAEEAWNEVVGDGGLPPAI